MPSRAITPVIQRGFLEICGPDTDKLLQGQLTCDLKFLDDQNSLLGACCTPKGRALTVFRAGRLASDRVFLRMPEALLEPVGDHLARYAVFFKVEVRPRPDWVILGLIEPAAGEQAGDEYADDTAWPVHSPVNQCKVTPNGFCVAVPGPVPRWEYWLAQHQAEAQWHGLVRHAIPVSTTHWEHQEILAGLPEVWQENTQAFIPQMLNLDRLGGISFDKGCYTGQEIIARMQYRGQTKKRLYAFSLDGTQQILPGTSVCQVGNNAPVGTVTNSAPDADTRTLLQAVIRNDAMDQGSLCLHDGAGPVLAPLPLPTDEV